MVNDLLHLVFGGRVNDPQTMEFIDPDNLNIIGIFPNYKQAYEAWKRASHANVDDAMIKYVVVHLHRFMHPKEG